VANPVTDGRLWTKSLSQYLRCAKRHARAGEVNESEVVLDFLFPADHESAEADHPRVGAFDDPAPRAIATNGAAFLGVLVSLAAL
jgi:hypothetical protein